MAKSPMFSRKKEPAFLTQVSQECGRRFDRTEKSSPFAIFSKRAVFSNFRQKNIFSGKAFGQVRRGRHRKGQLFAGIILNGNPHGKGSTLVRFTCNDADAAVRLRNLSDNSKPHFRYRKETPSGCLYKMGRIHKGVLSPGCQRLCH